MSGQFASLRGRTAIVTGGGTGIGRAIADALAAVGVDLVLVGRRGEVVEEAARDIAAATGVTAVGFGGDVREPETLETAFERAGELGGVDIVINNAGGQFPAPAEMISRRGWEAVIDVDLNATFFWSQRAARDWIAQERTGSIVNLVGPFKDRATPGMIHSGAARAAVVHMTRTLAVEWAPFGIRVNCFGPAVLTPGLRDELASGAPDVLVDMERRLPMGRWGTLEEAGQVTLFLVSDMAGFVTGETIVMDGGVWLGEGFGLRPISARRWVNDPDAAKRRDWAGWMLEAGGATE